MVNAHLPHVNAHLLGLTDSVSYVGSCRVGAGECGAVCGGRRSRIALVLEPEPSTHYSLGGRLPLDGREPYARMIL